MPRAPKDSVRSGPHARAKTCRLRGCLRLGVGPCLPGLRLSGHHAGRKLDSHLERFARRERAVEFVRYLPFVLCERRRDDPQGVLPSSVSLFDVGGPLLNRGRRRQMHAPSPHRKGALAIDCLPPELVAALVVAQTAVHGIGNGIGLAAAGNGREKPVDDVARTLLGNGESEGLPACTLPAGSCCRCRRSGTSC